MSYMNKVVVISGASAGIGRATAVEFARQGATVALLARGKAGLEGAKAEAELGPIELWVNNAMVTILAPVFQPEVAARAIATAVLLPAALFLLLRKR